MQDKEKKYPDLKIHLLLTQINVKTSGNACKTPAFACGNKGMLSQDRTTAEKLNELSA